MLRGTEGNKANEGSGEAIGAAIEVHRILGPGLLESIYEKCLLHELELRGMSAVRQEGVEIAYKDIVFSETLKFDVLIEGCLLLELKAVQDVLPIHKAQLFSYMKLLDVPLGLVINFHDMKLVDVLKTHSFTSVEIRSSIDRIVGRGYRSDVQRGKMNFDQRQGQRIGASNRFVVPGLHAGPRKGSVLKEQLDRDQS
ncbi:MAG: hypothetical protein CMJ64_02535 [Planctomycetaceae bacterium]|nr:hypothetical protein [Planctomycetaceae bacterium]